MFAASLLSLMTLGVSAPPDLAVLPILAKEAPPGDPGLGRLNRDLINALQAKWKGALKLISQEQSELTCPMKSCPPETADILGVHRAMVATLSPKYDHLSLVIYGAAGPQKTTQAKCTWDQGFVHCALTPAVTELMASRPLDRAAVQGAVKAQEPQIRLCYDKNPPKNLRIHYIARPRGRISNVRLMDEPPTAPAAACAARTLEALKIPSFDGDPEGIDQSLFTRSKKAKKKKKSHRRHGARSQAKGKAKAKAKAER